MARLHRTANDSMFASDKKIYKERYLEINNDHEILYNKKYIKNLITSSDGMYFHKRSLYRNDPVIRDIICKYNHELYTHREIKDDDGNITKEASYDKVNNIYLHKLMNDIGEHTLEKQTNKIVIEYQIENKVVLNFNLETIIGDTFNDSVAEIHLNVLSPKTKHKEAVFEVIKVSTHKNDIIRNLNSLNMDHSGPLLDTIDTKLQLASYEKRLNLYIREILDMSSNKFIKKDIISKFLFKTVKEEKFDVFKDKDGLKSSYERFKNRDKSKTQEVTLGMIPRK